MKELTVNEVLELGIKAHKSGQLQDANRYYTAILKSQPTHPDANHNLGVLTAGLGKMQESLSFFKKAVDTDPSVRQFWLSYIDALIKNEKSKEARNILELALPDVFNHNLETVPRLYTTIRPGSRYFVSLELLHDMKKRQSNLFTKYTSSNLAYLYFTLIMYTITT